jgi:hypothetical protein
MIDREITTYGIAKALKMDHLPSITKREIDGKQGSIADDLVGKFKDENTSFIKKYSLTTGDDAFSEIAKTDKRAGDKALFDFIVGNADRHGGNFFHKKNKDGSSELLAFDHGFTFPSSNSLYFMMDYHNQDKFNNAMQNSPLTNEFITNLKSFIEGGDMQKSIDHIKNTIGPKEAAAFKERMELVQNKVIKGSARTTKDIGYRKERFMT